MRAVLFLINGFGIETKDSYGVYDASIMPNFDKLSQRYMFSKLESNVFNTIDGFRSMSLEMNDLYNYGIYDRDAESGKVAASEVASEINNELGNRKSKLHLFCFVDTSLKIADNLKHFITLINKDKSKKIFIHIVLTSNNYQDFPKILEVLSKINIELGDMASIGMIMGLSNVLNSNSTVELNFLLRNMITEMGEKWTSFKQKLDFSYGTKASPSLVKPFVVNSGFSVACNDLFMIWNYDSVDISNFIEGVRLIDYGKDPNTIKFYSLFKINYKEEIKHILEYEVAKKSLAANMKGLAFKSMIMCEKDEVQAINYYLNGLQMVNNPDISFICLGDKQLDPDSIVNVINSYPQELVVISYNIKEVSTLEELKELLTKIDNVIGAIYSNTEKNSYSIIISSLYGMNKTLPNASGEICNVIYSKVPVIYIDNFITKKNYLINEGDISDLFRVCYKSIKKEYPGETLVTKKNFLYRLFFK